MLGYLIRRLFLGLLTVVVITAAVYIVARALPGAPDWDREISSRPVMEAWHERIGLEDPIPVGYVRWMSDFLSLDLGESISVSPGRPVSSLIGDALPFTALLGTIAFGLTLGLSIPLGVVSAWRPESTMTRFSTLCLYVLHALPAFWIAVALQHLFADRLGWLPSLGTAPPGEPALLSNSSARFWVLPSVSLALGSLAFVIRFCRSNLVQAAGQPYSRAARARGAGRSRVLFRHAMLNTAVPLISLTGLLLPGILGGSVLIETIFSLPGLGRLFFLAASQRDYPVIMALAVLMTTATLIAGAITDLMYRLADPRVTFDAMDESA